MVDYLQNGQTINTTYYSSCLWQLRENIRVKHCGKLCKAVLFHQDNAPARTSVIAMAAITPPRSPPPPPHTHPPQILLRQTDFHLFLKLKKAISGTHFQSYDDVIHAVEDFLDSQEQDIFISGIEDLQHSWQKCLDIEGNYVEK